ncbi:Hypothetical_protein [Hexamita inflata]|uniref:Hypothetical_protein n=1 Tax=Hexamita inflata TaxID=28002 RepID=A0AA86Q682_9EUKA|nr:Hypothetical protein HINF_LOCUS34277 [Hexamita inflata]CAI9946639.1 Hypothetical protein HINF_LOCUS34284 [Hexamita inflata]
MQLRAVNSTTFIGLDNTMNIYFRKQNQSGNRSFGGYKQGGKYQCDELGSWVGAMIVRIVYQKTDRLKVQARYLKKQNQSLEMIIKVEENILLSNDGFCSVQRHVL